MKSKREVVQELGHLYDVHFLSLSTKTVDPSVPSGLGHASSPLWRSLSQGGLYPPGSSCPLKGLPDSETDPPCIREAQV